MGVVAVRALGLCCLVGCRIHFDAVPTDDAATDAPIDAETDVCARSTTILCRDFENGFDASAVFGDATLAPADGRDGGDAVRMRGMMGSSGIARYNWTPSRTSGSVYARAYVRVVPGPPVVAYSVLIQLGNTAGDNSVEKVSGDIGPDDTYSLAGPFSAISETSTIPVPRDVWLCLELQLTIAASGGSARFLADGVLVNEATDHNTLLPAGYDMLFISSSVSLQDGLIEVLFDDLVIASEPIGC